MSAPQMTLEECIDKIESSYEYMLAYAAQGRDFESTGGDGPPIRNVVTDLKSALDSIEACFKTRIDNIDPPAREAFEAFAQLLAANAQHAVKAVDLVLATRNIGSQLVDNLNASMHLRALLTDMFPLDEATTSMKRASRH